MPAHRDDIEDPTATIDERDVDREPHAEGVHTLDSRQDKGALDTRPSEESPQAGPPAVRHLGRGDHRPVTDERWHAPQATALSPDSNRREFLEDEVPPNRVSLGHPLTHRVALPPAVLELEAGTRTVTDAGEANLEFGCS